MFYKSPIRSFVLVLGLVLIIIKGLFSVPSVLLDSRHSRAATGPKVSQFMVLNPVDKPWPVPGPRTRDFIIKT